MYSYKKSKGNRNHKSRSKKRYQRSKKCGSRCKKQIIGGNAFFAPTYNSSYVNPYMNYDLNTYSNIPTSESARNLPPITGGKRKFKRRSKTCKRNKLRKLVGGVTQPLSLNPISNSSGSSLINYSPYDIPMNIPYGTHNPALI